jgi:3-oxoadipate enol-lactonase
MPSYRSFRQRFNDVPGIEGPNLESSIPVPARRIGPSHAGRRRCTGNLGHSMGGKVAQFLASQRPPGLVGLVLVAPATPTPQNIPEPAKQAQLHAYDNRENALQAMAFLTAHPPSDTLRQQILADKFAARSPQAKLAWPTSSAYEDISGLVGNIAVPTLILAGDQDRQDPLEQHRREVLPRIPKARIVVIHDSGHLIPIDQPHQLAEAIRAFLLALTETGEV